jgi:hypothetical protein
MNLPHKCPPGSESASHTSNPLEPSPIYVDCWGEKVSKPEVTCLVDGRRWVFVFEPALKEGRAFHLGLFANMAALSDMAYAYPHSRRICVLFETPIHPSYRELAEIERRFPVVFTHQANLMSRGGPYIPLLIGMNWLNVWTDDDVERCRIDHPAKHQLVSFMGSLEHPDEGAYRFRREVAEYAMQRGDIACFGKGIRPVSSKRDALASFRFSIAMENAASDFYFSEKLIDCVLLETIPVYYGCPGISRLFDVRGMLLFRSLEELQAICDSLTPELYQEKRPFVLANKETAFRQRWYGHAPTLTRLAESFPAVWLPSKAMLPRKPAFLPRLLRLWRRFASPRG